MPESKLPQLLWCYVFCLHWMFGRECFLHNSTIRLQMIPVNIDVHLYVFLWYCLPQFRNCNKTIRRRKCKILCLILFVSPQQNTGPRFSTFKRNIFLMQHFRINWRKTATMVRTCKENARKQTDTENFRMGTRGNSKKGKTQREMDRWSKTEHDKPWTDGRGY
jgi:hypothetical protein